MKPIQLPATLANLLHWKNFSAQVLNYAVSGVILLLLWGLMARTWSIETFGQFNLMFALIAIYGFVADLGLDYWSTRQSSINPIEAYPKNLVIFKFLSSFFLLLVFALIGSLFAFSMTAFIPLLAGAVVLNLNNYFSCYLRGKELLGYEAALSLLRTLFFALGAWWSVLHDDGIFGVAVSYCAANIVGFIINYALIKYFKFSISIDSISLVSVLRPALLVWLSYLLISLSLRIDILMLGVLSQESEVALFSTASRLYEAALLFATAFILTVFPKLTQAYEAGQIEFRHKAKSNILLLLPLVCISAFIASLVVGLLFTTLYGDKYAEGSILFNYFMIIYPISALSMLLYQIMIIAHRTKSVIILLMVTLALNVLLSICLVPQFGAMGTLAAYCIKECLLLCGLIYLYMFRK